MGRYVEGRQHPTKIRFRLQAAAEEIIGEAWKLARVEEYIQIWIKKIRPEKREPL